MIKKKSTFGDPKSYQISTSQKFDDDDDGHGVNILLWKKKNNYYNCFPSSN